MRKPRPATYNPAQALQLIASDRTGAPLSCPSCSGAITRDPIEEAAAAALARHAAVRAVRPRRPLHRRRRLTHRRPGSPGQQVSGQYTFGVH